MVDVVDVQGSKIWIMGRLVYTCWPVFHYRFQLGGRTVQGTRLIFGPAKENHPDHVRKLLAPYQPGQWIKVRYNPYNPEDNVVELRQSTQHRRILMIAAILAGIGLLLAILGLAGMGAKVGGGR